MQLKQRTLNKLFPIILLLLSGIIFSSCGEDKKKKPKIDTEVKPVSIAQLNYTVTGTLPHDVTSFTEGLLFHNNELFESTGSPDDLPHTKSVIGPVDSKTGKIDVKVEIDRSKFFGEGLTFLKGKLYQLTYKNQLCFIYDATTYKPIGNFKYTSAEGWGMTTDGTHLIMSDGTDKISFINPETFKTEKTLNVRANGQALGNINELEIINGFLYANLYPTPNIVKIDMNSGNVVGRIDFTALFNEVITKYKDAKEMNGIAYNATTGLIYITGKFWPEIYQVEFPH